MNRHSCREKAMICLYQHRLLNKPMDEIIEEVMEMKTGELDDFSRILILDTLDNENRYIQHINETLKDWSFERLGVLEQAILLMACSELDHQTASAAIIIDEAVRLAKDYCDDEAYRLINGVLDRI